MDAHYPTWIRHTKSLLLIGELQSLGNSGIDGVPQIGDAITVEVSRLVKDLDIGGQVAGRAGEVEALMIILLRRRQSEAPSAMFLSMYRNPISSSCWGGWHDEV